MKRMFFIYVLSISITTNFAQEIKVSRGKIVSFKSFTSRYVTALNVDVWLPDGYTNAKKYAVLYMHDGQMLFDSTNTWQHQEWGVDETMSMLMDENKIKDCIVVGIWNSGLQRHTDYFPQKPFESLTQLQRDTIYNAHRPNNAIVFSGTVHSDDYLKFLVYELKPFIDSAFSVKKDKANTFIAGSSMGGLISMYAICEYPEVYGGAACLSTHWPGIFTNENNPIPTAMLNYLSSHLPSAKDHKLYFDHGTTTLDTLYAPSQLKADKIIRNGGYNSHHFMTKVYKGASHTEKSWASRLFIPLEFLLK